MGASSLFHGEAGVGDDDGEAEQGQPDGDAGHGEQQLEIGERTLPGKQEIDQQAKYDSGEREGRIHEDAEHVAAVPALQAAAGPVDAAAQTHKAVGTGVAATDEQPHAPER